MGILFLVIRQRKAIIHILGFRKSKKDLNNILVQDFCLIKKIVLSPIGILLNAFLKRRPILNESYFF